jgi:hypothetical protein
MRAVIGGMRYDTETAGCIAWSSNGHNTQAVGYYEEGLYRTVRGAWFLAGRGNARSSYARCYGNDNWGAGQRVTPFTAAEAQAWLEEHGEVEALEEHFGDSLVNA